MLCWTHALRVPQSMLNASHPFRGSALPRRRPDFMPSCLLGRFGMTGFAGDGLGAEGALRGLVFAMLDSKID